MKEKEILEHIEFAKNLVKEQPEPFKIESFKIILSSLLNSSNLIISEDKKSDTNRIIIEQKHKIQSSPETDTKIFEVLAEEAGMTLDQLYDTISIKEEKIEILIPFRGSNKAEKMIKAISCILLISDKFFNSPWVKSDVIAEYLRDLGLPDTGRNMSSYLKQNSKLFRIKGSGRFKEYKLTTPEGKNYALNIIKELSSNE